MLSKIQIEMMSENIVESCTKIFLFSPTIYVILMQIEMMSESIDETLDKDEAEEESEELTNQVHLNK